jgi:hypothetical protein
MVTEFRRGRKMLPAVRTQEFKLAAAAHAEACNVAVIRLTFRLIFYSG